MAAALGLDLTSDADAESGALEQQAAVGFRTAYLEHFGLVWRGLRRLGVSESLLEDAVQDVFLVAHRRWAEFEGRSQLKTWIYGIAVRVAKDYRRAEARRFRRVERLSQLAAAEPRSVPPSDEPERREAHRLLYRALGRLTDEERAVFVLAELEELPLREVALALRLHLRTCQRRLKRARLVFESIVSEPSSGARELNHE